MTAKAAAVDNYLAALPAEQRKVLSAVRNTIRKNLPSGYEEVLQGRYISYVVPLSRFPKTYNGQPLWYVSMVVQKNYYALHMVALYGSPKELAKVQAGYKKAGKKLDMGKACIRFKKLEDLPLDVIGESVAGIPMEDYISRYLAVKSK
jgi:uncharacterized protein YdhG (YjbR/CyaY superfamily)